MARRQSVPVVVAFPVADTFAVLALHGESDRVTTTFPRRLQCIAADPVSGCFCFDVDVFRRSADGILDVVAIEDAEHGIDARCPLEHLGPVSLHEATGDHHAFDDTLDSCVRWLHESPPAIRPGMLPEIHRC